MSVVISSKKVKTRAEHICFGCARSFPKGSIMHREGIADGGTVWTSYLCETCKAITSGMCYGDEFGYADLRDEAMEREAMERGDWDGKIDEIRWLLL